MKTLKKSFWLVPLLAFGVLLVAPQHVEAAKNAEASPITSSISVAPVNLNKADLGELESVKGIGPALAGRILAYRDENGKFKSSEELMNVRGIGLAKFEKVKDQITV